MLKVKIGDVTCSITSITDVEIECDSESFTKVYRVTNGGRHASKILLPILQ